VGTECPYMSCV
jgi:hypothetical protein